MADKTNGMYRGKVTTSVFNGVTSSTPVKAGDWVYGDLVHKYDRCFILPYKYIGTDIRTGEGYTGGELYFSDWFEVIPASVSQFTGLKDKNGKDAYQGETYNIDKYTDKYQVRWDESSARFYLHGINGGCHKDIRMLRDAVLFDNPNKQETKQ